MKVIMIFFKKIFKLLLFIYKLYGIEKVIYMNIYADNNQLPNLHRQ